MKKTRQSAQSDAVSAALKITEKLYLPELDQLPKIDAFYKRIADRCHKFCRDTLPSLYARGDLLYCIRSELERRDGILRVQIRVSLADRSAMRLLFVSEQSHEWSEEHQLLIKVVKVAQKRGDKANGTA